jgi:hypothetical protein
MSGLVYAESKGVTIDVGLSPAGSFQITSSKVKGNLSKTGGKIGGKNISVSVRSMKTGIELRDDHMQKRLEPKKYKKIIIEQAIGAKGNGVAIINVKGIKKKIKFVYKEIGSLVKATFKLSLKDFKIKDLRYMGVGVEDEVKVTALVPLK